MMSKRGANVCVNQIMKYTVEVVIFQVVTVGEISMKYFYEYKVSEITIEYPTKCLD